jgi:DNA-binding response OmpR family regulator
MNAQGFGGMARVLLIESDSLVRGTVASVCRDMALVKIIQANSLARGEHCLQASSVQGLMLSLAEGDAALDLLARLREKAFACDAAIPVVVVMASACTKEQAVRLKALAVQRLLLQPFRMRDVIHTVEQLWPAAPDVAAQPAPSDAAVS